MSDSTLYVPRVIFQKINNSREKLKFVHILAKEHFERGHHLQILVENEASLHYLDELLWSFDEMAFLPHIAIKEPQNNKEYILLSIAPSSSPLYKTVLNLTSSPLVEKKISFQTIYELDDNSESTKKMIAKDKYHSYKEHGYKIASF